MNNDELLIAIKDMFDKKVDEIKQDIYGVKQHTGMLIEKLQSDIKTIAEGHSILDRKLDEGNIKINKKIDEGHNLLDRKIDSLHSELIETRDELKREIAVVKDYVIGVDTKLNEHETILKRVK